MKSEAESPKSPLEKALKVNLDDSRYGSFAEIGAGQEVARFFFLAGKASQTIAKSMSAYDMTFSDEIYGRELNGRYVCDSRVKKMLAKEFDLLLERLGSTKGDDHSFFAFANTCATGDVKRSHGWMGVRFQNEPRGSVHEVICHVRMLDKHRLMQQESLGILGVNLIHAAFYKTKSLDEFLTCLMENINEDQIAIDLLRFSGSELSHFNNHLVNIELVRRGIAEAVIFSPDFEIVNLSDATHNKALLIQRGTYRPITNTHVDILSKGLKQLETEVSALYNPPAIMPILEISLAPPIRANGDNQKLSLTKQKKQVAAPVEFHLPALEPDLLSRIEIMTKAGYHVLVSNLYLFYKLKKLIRMYTNQPLAMVLSANNLLSVFDDAFYLDLEGGIAEGLGKLLDENTRLYIYPHKTNETCLTTKSFFPSERLLHLFRFFLSTKLIVDIANCDDIHEYIHSKDVTDRIEAGKPWEALIPREAMESIKNHQLFGYGRIR